MAVAPSACSLGNHAAWHEDFVVKGTFIDVPKAPTLKRVFSESDIHSCRYSWADAETTSNVTDDDCLTLAETASTGKDAEAETIMNDETASDVTILDNDPFDWIETASWKTEYDFEDESPPSSFPPTETAPQVSVQSTTNLDVQAAHLKAQAQKMEEVALFVRKAAQLKVQAREAEQQALLARRAALLQAQVQEAEAAARLARAKAQALSQMSGAADLNWQSATQQPVNTECKSQMVWCPVSNKLVPASSACSKVTPAHHATVSKKKQKGPSALSTSTQEEFTTLMLRNIPNSYSRNMLLEVLDKEGFSGLYDLVYVPVDFGRLAGLGYAFVNFVSNDVAESARQTFHGFTRWSNTSQKVCEVSWSGPIQGLSAHIEHYRNSPVMHESVPEHYKPALFQDGLRRPFPCPTKEIRAPRVKRGGFPSK